MKQVDTLKYDSYIVMPNYHLRDKRLSFKARGLFSVILNLPKEWSLTQGGLIAISDKDGERSVRTAMDELIKYGYLTRERQRTEDGSLSKMVYIIHPNPTEGGVKDDEIEDENTENHSENHSGKNVETVESDESSTAKCSHGFKHRLDFPVLQNSGLQNAAQLNKLHNKINYLIKDRLIDPRARENVFNSSPVILKSQYRSQIMRNIDYQTLSVEFDSQLGELDELLELMVDVLISDSEGYTVIAGEKIPTVLVQDRFLSLRKQHIAQVLTNLVNTSASIRNIHAYLLTCLYRSFATANNQINQENRYRNQPGKSETAKSNTPTISAAEWAMAQLR